MDLIFAEIGTVVVSIKVCAQEQASVQSLSVDARPSSTCSCRVTSLDHKVLKFEMSATIGVQGNRCTHGNDAMEHDAIVVSPFR